MTDKPTPKSNETAWRQGYDAGMRVNQKEAKLGKAIIDALSDFFELKKEDYD